MHFVCTLYTRIIQKAALVKGKSIFSAIFGGFFADFRLCFSNLKYARDCRRRRLHPSQADELGSATIPQKDGRVHPKGSRGRSQTSSVFMPPRRVRRREKPAATRKIKSHRKRKSRKKRKESRLPSRICENRRLQKSNQANAIIPESHAAAH